MFAIMNLKYLTALLVLLMAAGTSLATSAEETEDKKIQEYLNKLENADIEKIMTNDRLVTNYINCLLDVGPCTSQQLDIKKMIPVLLKNNCKVCSKSQKNLVKGSMDKVKTFRPDDYEKLTQVYDPEGIYEKKFLDSLNE